MARGSHGQEIFQDGTLVAQIPLGQLRESLEYGLWEIGDKKPGVLAELAAEQAEVLEKESAELEKQAERLAGEIEELAGEAPGRIG
jgi:hypothetical protein